jgi:hypothetical protein
VKDDPSLSLISMSNIFIQSLGLSNGTDVKYDDIKDVNKSKISENNLDILLTAYYDVVYSPV